MSNIGSESVEVVPDARGFVEKLRAQLANLPKVQIQLDTGEAATKIEAVKTQVRSISATRAKVTADTSEIDAKIAGIKAEIKSIQSNRLTIDIDTAKATAQIAALRVQEKALKDEISGFQSSQGNNSVPVDAGRQLQAVQQQITAIQNQRLSVRVDTAEADAKIAALRAELDAATRERTAKLTVDDNGSTDGLIGKFKGLDAAGASAAAGVVGRMALIGLAITAIIPLAAAASIAVAGIGAGIGLGILGALVGKLALGGVSSALSASNTPSSGGTSQAQALDNQRQAEVALTVAQRNAVDAQKALTQARIDAVQTLQDLSNQVTDNGLAQRQAVLDLQTAQQNLATAKANPDSQNPANAGALAQVQLAADQAGQNLTELQEKGQSLAAQQATAVAAGVDGAASVVSAQNSVTDSQNALTEAQFQAAHASSVAGGSLTAYQQALEKLDPAQRKFVEFIQSIKPALSGVQNAAADSFLPKLQTAITLLLPVLPTIADIVGKIGSAFGDLAINASKFFTSPDGQKFLKFIQDNIGPAIDTFGKIFGGLFKLGVSVFEAAYPLIKQFGDALAGALGSADNSVKGGALDGFFAYLKENAPQIKKTLEDVGGAIVSIFKSLGPDGGPALKAISQVAKDLAGLAKVAAPLIKELLPFAPEILAIALAFKVIPTNPIQLVVLAVLALAFAIYELIDHSKFLRDLFGDLDQFLVNVMLPAFRGIADFLVGEFKLSFAVVTAVINDFIGLPGDIKKAWGDVTGFFSDMWKDVTGAFSSGIDEIKGLLSDVKGGIVGAWHDIWDGLAGIATSAFDGIASAIKTTINGVIDVINGAIKFINEDVIGPANDVTGLIGQKISKLPYPIQHLADGGLITGSGGPRSDNVLLAGSPGEYVVNADATAKNYAALQAINNGQQVKGGLHQINNFNGITDPDIVIAGVTRRFQFAGA